MKTLWAALAVLGAVLVGARGMYGTYLRRERSYIEELGFKVEGPHYVAPYTEWTLRGIRASE